MSQELVPIKTSTGDIGLSPVIVTSTNNSGRIKIFSNEYKETKNLRPQITQWNPIGRPIYGRLPAASEQYQQDFFEEGGLGYVFIPRGGDLFGPGSLYVNQSENLEVLLIEDGAIVWAEGTTPTLKTIVDMRELGVEDGRYLVAYQLLYDDAPEPLPFQVSDFSLGGLDFTVTDSASIVTHNSEDAADPWPFPGINLFAAESLGLAWQNYLEEVNKTPAPVVGIVPGIPEYEQPLFAEVQWSSPLPWKLDVIKLRTNLTENIPACSLYIESEDPDDPWQLVQTSSAKKDLQGFYWEFFSNLTPQRKWKLDWGFVRRVNAFGLTVSGVLYVETAPSTPRARTQLAIYPTNLIPEDESLCRLAIISVDNYKIARRPNGELWKDDIRAITNRDYEPVADWLTEYWDSQLVSLWEQTKLFSPNFMAPPTLMKVEYGSLEKYGIAVSSDPLPYPPNPPKATEVNFIGASVTLSPPIPRSTSLVEASVSFFSDPTPSQITAITINVEP